MYIYIYIYLSIYLPTTHQARARKSGKERKGGLLSQRNYYKNSSTEPEPERRLRGEIICHCLAILLAARCPPTDLDLNLNLNLDLNFFFIFIGNRKRKGERGEGMEDVF